MTLPGFRALLYAMARFLGDARAVQRGRVWQRVARRLAGRLAGRWLFRWFR